MLDQTTIAQLRALKLDLPPVAGPATHSPAVRHTDEGMPEAASLATSPWRFMLLYRRIDNFIRM